MTKPLSSVEEDPLAVLIKKFTPEDYERERLRRAEFANREITHFPSRIPSHLVVLWCEWNRKVEGGDTANRLAYEFGQFFSRECLGRLLVRGHVASRRRLARRLSRLLPRKGMTNTERFLKLKAKKNIL